MPEETFGSYSTEVVVVNERFAVKIPKEYAGPVFCAGIT